MTKPARDCIFFRQGRCRNGANCTFRHEVRPQALGSSASASPPDANGVRLQTACRFYPTGACAKGDSCLYQHEQPGTSGSMQSLGEDDPDLFVRTFRGALVHYGDGACVSKLSLIYESSSVRLEGLPKDSTALDVTSLLMDLQLETTLDSLRIVAAPDTTSSAYINAADFDIAGQLNDRLKSNGRSELKAVSVPARLPSWASTRRVGCKVDVVWQQPRVSISILFDTQVIARRVAGKFNSGKYRVLGKHVQSTEPQFLTDTRWIIELSEIPQAAEPEDVLGAITAPYDNYQSFAVEQEHGNRFMNKQEKSDLIRSELLTFGPLAYLSDLVDCGGFLSLTAQFEHERDTRRAASRLSDRVFHDGQLQSTLIFYSTFKTSNAIYGYVKETLHDFHATRGQNISIKPKFTQSGTSVVLTIEGKTPAHLATATGFVEDVLSGVRIAHNEQPLWHHAFSVNGPEYEQLRQLQRKHGVLLLRNKSKREIRAFCPPQKLDVITEGLREVLGGIKKTHCIELDDKGFRWARQSGLEQLTDTLEDEAVSLDLESAPHRITILGTEADYSQALAIIAANNIEFVSTPVQQKPDCCICWCPADDPITLDCTHAYCTNCFADLCKSSSTTADLQVICKGSNDTCKRTISLKEIQSHLSHTDFEDLLEKSFESYISCRPDQFHFCPTPDCGYVYRPTTVDAPFAKTCAKCFELICTSCHVSHEGLSCEDRRGGEAFEQFKQDNSERVKDCPRCKTTVEKIDGCNHVHCGGCKIHLCWVCLATFEQAGECYGHMNLVHGGFGVDNEDV